MSVLYEKGSAAWDISMILTRHADGYTKSRHGDYAACSRVLELRRTAQDRDAQERLRLALSVVCSCGAGDSSAERSSIRQDRLPREDQNEQASAGAGDGASTPLSPAA